MLYTAMSVIYATLIRSRSADPKDELERGVDLGSLGVLVRQH